MSQVTITIKLDVDLGGAFTGAVVNAVSELIRTPSTRSYGSRGRQPGLRGADDRGFPPFMVDRSGTITSTGEWAPNVAVLAETMPAIGTWSYGDSVAERESGK